MNSDDYQGQLESKAMEEVASLMENFRMTNFSISKKLQGRDGYRVIMVFDEPTEGIDFVYDMNQNRVCKGDVVFFKDGGLDGVKDKVVDFIKPTGEVLMSEGYVAMPNQIELCQDDDIVPEEDAGGNEGYSLSNYAEGNM